MSDESNASINNLISAAREVAMQQSVPAAVFDVELLVAAVEAVTGLEVDLCRELFFETCLIWFPQIRGADELREDAKNPTGAFIARAIFERARLTNVDIVALANEAVIFAMTSLRPGFFTRSGCELMLPAFFSDIRREYESMSGHA
jgi:hypothetical protein